MRGPRPHPENPRSFSASLGAFALALVLFAEGGALAQEGGEVPAPPEGSAPAPEGSAPAPHPITLKEVVEWKAVRSATLSSDGSWFAYVLAPDEGDAELHVVRTDSDRTSTFPVGEPPSGGGRFGGGGGGRDLEFSDDGRWIAFRVQAPRAENQKKKAGARGRAARSGSDGKFPKVALVELETGNKVEFENVTRFAFSGERSTWLALHKKSSAARPGFPAGGAAGGDDDGDDDAKERPTGADLLLRRLADGRTLNLGSISEFAFDDTGRWLATTVEAADRTSNGLQLHELDAGRVRILDSGEATYRRLSWTEAGDALCALRGHEDKKIEGERHVLLGFTTLDADAPRRVEYDPRADDSFPAGFRISENRTPAWADDLAGLTFGIAELEAKEDDGKGDEEDADADADKETEGDAPKDPSDRRARGRPRGRGTASDEPETADLVVWHWRDRRLQSQQQVQASRDERFTYLCRFDVAEGRFQRLSDETVRDVTLEPDDRFAVGTDDSAYELSSSLEGRRYQDVYVVDPRTGGRVKALDGIRWFFDADPTGRRLLYYRDRNFHAYDMENRVHHDLTAGLPVDFVDEEDDHNVTDPPVPPLGWSEDGAFALLSDGFDVWRVAADGSSATNLTRDGREKEIRYGRAYDLDPEDEGIDLTQPVYVSMQGKWTKRGGIARLTPGSDRTEVLLWDDASFGRLMKAENADVFTYTRETCREFPNYHLADASLVSRRRLTDANPEQTSVAWCAGARLVDFESAKGDRLQAALLLPADHDPSRRYPTIVYIYERLSDGLHRYLQPSAYGFNPAVYTSRGYAVLMPDITYKINDPGMSALWCVLPALDAAIATGVVDADRVGLQGHSWGGYQTAFLITQTDRFAAAVAGAPLTNMISMYSSIYWNTGSANQPIFESSQGRFSGDYLANPESYARNSPVYHARNVSTPLVILHNDKDGAVDWNQGIEYFNTLRRLQKPVVMLQYEGENHGLRDPANRLDYFVRMGEFFDHHLKGNDAPDWWQDGVDHLDHEKHLEARARELEREKRGPADAERTPKAAPATAAPAAEATGAPDASPASAPNVPESSESEPRDLRRS